MNDATVVVQVEELTSGASGRIIPLFRKLRRSVLSYDAVKRALILIHSLFLWILLFILPRRHRSSSSSDGSSPPSSPRSLDSADKTTTTTVLIKKKKFALRKDEEDALRRRAIAEALQMVVDEADDLESETENEIGMGMGSRRRCVWSTSLFFGVRRNALFCRSWLPSSGEMKGIMIIIHGLNEHSGRYAHFARHLNSCNYGVYAMDWIGHGGSDGLHGYVPSLDHVVADTGAFLEKIKLENPTLPCFLFGHSTGGAVVLKAATYPHIESMVEGIILTSPALRVKPSHPIVKAVAPLFSLVAPRYQFKGSHKRGVAVSRDPAALHAKYSDPLVYTGALRVRTGHEILRISSFLTKNFKYVTVPFFVLHGTADRVTDPLASKDLYEEAASEIKDIRLYDGFLHDLLFEPERDEIAQDIIDWMNKKLYATTAAPAPAAGKNH